MNYNPLKFIVYLMYFNVQKCTLVGLSLYSKCVKMPKSDILKSRKKDMTIMISINIMFLQYIWIEIVIWICLSNRWSWWFVMNEYLINICDEYLICEYDSLNDFMANQYAPFFGAFESHEYDYIEWD